MSVVLRRGETTSFPTHAWPQNTKLTVHSQDPNNYGAARVKAGVAEEEVGTTGGGTTTIDRGWGGVIIYVTNVRNDMEVPIEVWTE